MRSTSSRSRSRRSSRSSRASAPTRCCRRSAARPASISRSNWPRPASLERYGVELLGTPLDTIKLAEDRERFKSKMIEIGEPVPQSAIVTDIESGVAFARRDRLPARRASRLHAGRHRRRHRLRRSANCARRSRRGLDASLIHQVLRRDVAAGLERDRVRSPARSRRQLHHRLQHGEHRSGRRAHRRLDRRRAVADALRRRLPDAAHGEHQRHPRARRAGRLQHPVRAASATAASTRSSRSTRAYRAVPRWHRKPPAIRSPRSRRRSRSAKRSTRSRIPVTGVTKAAYEPTLDYCVVKIPRWPFDKFPLRRHAAGHADEVDRRGDGHRPHVSRGAA